MEREYMWRKYIVNQKWKLLHFVVISALFLFVQWLYNQPLDSVLYSIQLLGIGYVVYIIYDIIKMKNMCDQLERNREQKNIDEIFLPTARNEVECCYQQIIQYFFEEKKKREQEFLSRYENQREYYTQWVHQIKTPISAMQLLLKEKELQGITTTDMEAEMLKIEQYVDMVLQYIRMEEVTTDFVLQSVNVATIVKQAVKKFAIIFFQKKIEISIDTIEINPISDEKWLSFVIEQILSNSLKYTQAGKISIYEEDKYTLVIEDTGIGIPKEDIKRIFEKGYTGWNGREYKKASGIGLFLSKKILEKLGHHIEVESKVKKGTKVRIRFSGKEWNMF